MKRLIPALLLVVLAAPAFADDRPVSRTTRVPRPDDPAGVLATERDELLSIIRETESAEAFLMAVEGLVASDPTAPGVLPAVIRNADRLGLLKGMSANRLTKEQEALADVFGHILDARASGVGPRPALAPAYAPPPTNAYVPVPAYGPAAAYAPPVGTPIACPPMPSAYPSCPASYGTAPCASVPPATVPPVPSSSMTGPGGLHGVIFLRGPNFAFSTLPMPGCPVGMASLLPPPLAAMLAGKVGMSAGCCKAAVASGCCAGKCGTKPAASESKAVRSGCCDCCKECCGKCPCCAGKSATSSTGEER